jgi:hypothetical protein
MVSSFLLAAFISVLLIPSIVFAESEQFSNINEIMTAVSRLCSLPGEKGSDIEFEGSVEAGGIVKLVGVKGEGKLSYEEWEGIQDVLAHDRVQDRKSSRECVQNILPIFLKAYNINAKDRNELSNYLKREASMQDHFVSEDPARRAVAFREGFRSISIFFVDLTPVNPSDKGSSSREARYETSISKSINYYDYNTGKFADKKSGYNYLKGHIHGDTLAFVAQTCSGTLRNIHGTWEFTGPVTCGGYRYSGHFSLR